MRKSIALIVVFSLMHALALGEPARPAAEPRASASPIFADSFGLNPGHRVSAGKGQGSPLERGAPAAASFGLKSPPTLAGAGCQAAAKVAMEPGMPAGRCIEI